MNIQEQLKALADAELERANAIHPQFHSAHEGYAVLLEEVDEYADDMRSIRELMSNLWHYTKINDDAKTRATLIKIKYYGLNAACEAVQVAAMAQKFLDMCNAEGGQTPRER